MLLIAITFLFLSVIIVVLFKMMLKVLCIKYDTIGALIKEHNKILLNLSE